MRSLSARLLLSISALLLIFFSITALVLDKVFRDAAEDSTAALLEIQRNSLLTAMELDDQDQLLLPEMLSEARFSNPGSGLLGFIAETVRTESGELENQLVWKSPSALGIDEPDLPILSVGSSYLHQANYANESYYQENFVVEWDDSSEVDGEHKSHIFVISVAQSMEAYKKQLNSFRTRLFSWFAGLIAIMLLTIGALMRWVLQPLRRVEKEVSEIDSGERDVLSDDYPTELVGVARNTNALIRAERSRLERYRNTLGNLAHSLKTPLAIIKTSTEKEQVDKQQIQNQIKQMDDIVGYQLKRAAAAGTTLGRDVINVKDVADSIVGAMTKVHFDKGIEFDRQISADLVFHGDKGDLTELLGNLIDNACKWCHAKVRINIQALSKEKRSGICIEIEDDGQGIAEEVRERILKRGQRADENTPGHGIGLAIAKEIVLSYEGSLDITDSGLGGAKFLIQLPTV